MKLNLRPPRRVLVQFAWIAAVMFVLLPALLIGGWRTPAFTSPWALALGALGLLQLALFLLGAAFLTRWLFAALTTIAFPIGFALSHVLIAAIYYLVITPIGLVFRLIGRDAMQRRFDPALPSYWHDRGPPRKPASYFKLY